MYGRARAEEEISSDALPAGLLPDSGQITSWTALQTLHPLFGARGCDSRPPSPRAAQRCHRSIAIDEGVEGRQRCENVEGERRRGASAEAEAGCGPRGVDRDGKAEKTHGEITAWRTRRLQQRHRQGAWALFILKGVVLWVSMISLWAFSAAARCPGTNGHLRFGTITYRQVSGYTVIFTIETQWRRSYSSENVFAGTGVDGRAISGDVVDVPGVQVSATGVAGPVVFLTGDGAQHPLFLYVTHHAYNTSEDFLHGYSSVTHTFEAPNDGGNDWLASLNGCCRQYGERFKEFQITARVNLAYDGEALRSKALPVLVITDSPVLQYANIAANTYTGLKARAWRIGQGSELGTAVMPPTSSADFPEGSQRCTSVSDGKVVCVGPSGMLQLNGSALGVGCYPLVVQIASVRSVTPHDFVIQVIRAEQEPLRPVFILGKPLVTNFSAPGIRSPATPQLSGYAGYEIYFTLSTRTTRPGARMADIRSFALPEGAALVNRTSEGVPGQHVMHIDFRWTPQPAQSEYHYVCFEAIDAPALETDDILSSGQHCVELYVNRANPAPVFEEPAVNVTKRFFMAVPNAFVVSGTNENPYDNIVLKPQYPLTVGQALSPPVASEKRIKATDSAARVSAGAVFSWQPGIDLGAYQETLCFVLSQAGGPGITPARSTRCVVMLVERCKYVTQPGDDMRKVGALFKSDWLSLWALNVELQNFDPPPATEILIGRLYVVQKGDTLQSIAKEFGTSIARIKELNYDLSDTNPAARSAERSLGALKSICVFPDTCNE